VYDVTARFYDKIYAFKDFPAEAERLVAFIHKLRPEPGGRLLDVACGTGAHLAHLRRNFEVEGLDLSPLMLEAARGKLPGVAFHEADMTDFELGRRFDVVTCLFSSIGYAVTEDALFRAVGCMARHLAPDGERHEMGLFEREEVEAAIVAAGLEPSYDAEGLDGRGLHLGLKK
jgi:ubiquinone/menaquinone biosynthesis C-methylase UbiE